jgi:hypothetical protein
VNGPVGHASQRAANGETPHADTGKIITGWATGHHQYIDRAVNLPDDSRDGRHTGNTRSVNNVGTRLPVGGQACDRIVQIAVAVQVIPGASG